MVRGVERIQNAKLWAKYSLRRAEVSEARAGNPNEMMLFHGADRDTLKVLPPANAKISVVSLWTLAFMRVSYAPGIAMAILKCLFAKGGCCEIRGETCSTRRHVDFGGNKSY